METFLNSLKFLLNWKLMLKIVISVVLIFFSTYMGVFCARTYIFMNDFEDLVIEELDSIENVSELDTINVLIMGIDENYNNDTIMVASVSDRQKKINLVSIPRDTRVPYGSRYGKINESIAIGEQEVSKRTIGEPEEIAVNKVKLLMDIPVHYVITFNTAGFREIIDILGGVDFDVPDIEGNGRGMNHADPPIHLRPGLQHLNGAQAEGIVRYRSGYPEADIARIRMQQSFLKALLDQKLQPQYILKANELFTEISKHVKTNFTANDIIKYSMFMRDFDIENFKSYQLPGSPQFIGGESFFICDTERTGQLVNEIMGEKELVNE